MQRNPICSLRELHTGNPISLKVTKCFFLFEIRLAGKYFFSNLNASFSILYWTNCPSLVSRDWVHAQTYVFFFLLVRSPNVLYWVNRLGNNCCSRLMAPSLLKPFMIISVISTLPPCEGRYIFRPKKKKTRHYICFFLFQWRSIQESCLSLFKFKSHAEPLQWGALFSNVTLNEGMNEMCEKLCPNVTLNEGLNEMCEKLCPYC